MSTVNVAAVTLVAVIVNDPVTLLVLPTAVPLWPNSVSFTRYRTSDPLPIFHVPASDAREPVAADEDTGVVPSDSGGGGSSWMKWKYTKGPPTTIRTTTTTPATTQRIQFRGLGVGSTRDPDVEGGR